jgi:predicted component of type VI protein secretion system
MDFLFIEEQPMAGRECMAGSGVTVGREGCDHVLPDPEVSRTHATFRGVDGQLGIEDAGSTNGTFVNEARVSGIQVLVPGDRLRFGNTVWRFERASDPSPKAAATVHAQVPEALLAAPTRDAGDRVPTGLRAAIPTGPVEGAAPVFDAARPPRRILGASAARRMEATVACYAVIVATACGVVAFFVQR